QGPARPGRQLRAPRQRLRPGREHPGLVRELVDPDQQDHSLVNCARGAASAAPRPFWTCEAAAGMKVTLMIADFARVASGKLEVIGGGLSVVKAAGAVL